MGEVWQGEDDKHHVSPVCIVGSQTLGTNSNKMSKTNVSEHSRQTKHTRWIEIIAERKIKMRLA